MEQTLKNTAPSGRNKKKKKKRRSQAPVALAYFITLLFFLGVFGIMAFFIVQKLTSDSDESVDFSDTYIDAYNTVYARINSQNVLSDLSLIRVCPEKQAILVVPMSALTVSETDGTSTLREVYESGGIKQLAAAVEKTYEVDVDYYVTMSNSAFEDCADIVGGYFYTSSEELYYLVENSANDISIKAGESINLTGKQIRLICQYNIFSEGRQKNVEFLGEAMTGLINNAFDQTELTKSMLDNIYNKLASGGTTNLTENIYKEHRVYLKAMLEEQIQPAYSLIPEGQWADETHFIPSDEFKQMLAEEIEATENSEIIEE